MAWGLVLGVSAACAPAAASANAPYPVLKRDARPDYVSTNLNMSTPAHPMQKPLSIVPVQLTPEERAYLMQLFRGVAGIIEHGERLGQTHPLLGKGTIFTPKTRAVPAGLMLTFDSRNFPMKKVDVTFKRPTAASPWEWAGLMIAPRYFPGSVYDNNLPAELLAGFELTGVRVKESPNGNVKQSHVYEYRKRLDSGQLVLEISSHPELSTLGDNPPGNFYYMEIKRN